MATTVHKYGLLSSLIDIVDEEWAKETLPDDDIPLPASMQLQDSEEEQKAAEPEKWLELGLSSLG